jgi:pSer/pThr/pTyr-binding forkhead associated (FHA) protein
MAYLAFNLNNGSEFVFDLLEERLTIGRDPRNDIVIDNNFISGFHAEFIRQSDGVYELVDLNSSHGTRVNGNRVERCRVKGGDRIIFGQLEAFFRDRAPKGTIPAKTTTWQTPPSLINRNVTLGDRIKQWLFPKH